MKTLSKIAMIHLVAIAIVSFCVHAEAMEYDVDMPGSGQRDMEMIRITVEGCESKFFIKKENFEKVTSNPAEMKEMAKQAIKKAARGCPK